MLSLWPTILDIRMDKGCIYGKQRRIFLEAGYRSDESKAEHFKKNWSSLDEIWQTKKDWKGCNGRRLFSNHRIGVSDTFFIYVFTYPLGSLSQ